MTQRDHNNLPNWLPAQIQRAGLTSSEALARRADVSRNAIYRYLSDEDRPSTQTMARICKVLGVSLEEGLRQYTAKRVGRPKGSGGNAAGNVKEVSTHKRKVKQ